MKAFLTLAAFLTLVAATMLAQPVVQPQPPSFTPSTPPPPDKVVATVDGHDVTFGELRSMLSMTPPAAQSNPQLALQNYYIMHYLAGEGDKLKLADQSPLKEELEFQRMNVVAGAYLNYHRETDAVPDGAVDAYYKANLSKYEQAKIKIIYIAYKPAPTGAAKTTEDLAREAQAALAQAHSVTNRTEAEAKALADEVVKKARSIFDFEALVAQYSDDAASKAAKGDYGVIKPDSPVYPQEMKKAALALKTGEVSDPVKMPGGFYIIRAEERTTQPLSEVGTQVLQSVRQEMLNQWFQGLSKRFKPEIKDPAAFVQSGATGNIQLPAQPPK